MIVFSTFARLLNLTNRKMVGSQVMRTPKSNSALVNKNKDKFSAAASAMASGYVAGNVCYGGGTPGYSSDVVAYRCVNMIASAAASVPLKVRNHHACLDAPCITHEHPLVRLLVKPNFLMSGHEFIESMVAHLLIYGHTFVRIVESASGDIEELLVLHPSRVSFLVDEREQICGYTYQVSHEENAVFPVSLIDGDSGILHISGIHPDGYESSVSPMMVARDSITQHLAVSRWNHSLVKHGARPFASVTIRDKLSDEQYSRLRTELKECLGGEENAGRTLLLEGDMQWQDRGLKPRDMDYVGIMHTSLRSTALAFGVPPQLLGIPGDNTYSNLAEARVALWEQTVIPTLDKLIHKFNSCRAIAKRYKQAEIYYDENEISAIAGKRDYAWSRVKGADFLSPNEKRMLLGLPPMPTS